MKNALKLLPSLLFVLIFLYCALLYSSDIALAVFDGINICLKTVIPSLFPFFIISSLTVDTGLGSALAVRIKGVMPILFKANKAGITPFLLGLIGGYPIGASCIVSLYNNRLCSKYECEHLLSFCNNCGPGFIISAVGAGLLGDVNLGIFLYLIHIISCIATGLIMRFFIKKEAYNNNLSDTAAYFNSSFPFAFTQAVKKSISSCGNVCAFIISFGMLIKLLSCTGILYSISNSISSLIPFSSNSVAKVLNGTLEVTNGVIGIAEVGSNLPIKLIIISALLGWGGLSVHFQTLSLIGDTGLSAKKYFVGKTLQALLSALFSSMALKSAAVQEAILTFSSSFGKKISVYSLNKDLLTCAIGAFLLFAIFMFIFFYYIFQNNWKRREK